MGERRNLRIRPVKRLRGTVTLPGDKSLSHRALLFAALAEGVSRIGNCLMAGVTQAMMDCLQELGVAVEIEVSAEARNGAANLIISRINGNGLTAPSIPLQCRGSATTMRLLAGVLAGQGFKSTLDGNHRLRTRPMERVVRPLREKGAEILTDNGNAPLHFHPSHLRSSEHLLAEASAQVKSAILLAGLFSEGPTTVIEPHLSRDHTERMLRRLGVPVEEWIDADGRHVARISGKISSLPALDLDLPSDPSAAAFFLVAGLLVPLGNVKIPNVCLNPGRTGLFEVLRSMGADLTIEDRFDSGGEPTGTVTAVSSDLDAVTVQGALVARMIDEFPIFAVAATQARGTTSVRDARELRFKESDRIEALAHELNKMGAGIETTTDGFVIRGPVRLRGAAVNAQGDHRLGMSLGVAGMIAEGATLIEGWEAISDSLPVFPRILEQLGADLEW